jgi:asparaginyl-tRNA synthetase
MVNSESDSRISSETDNPSADRKENDDFFRSQKYLTVSSQLHLEALAQSVGKVWTLSPTFRAEKSETNRHLSEFYMLEAELCFVEDLGEVMDVVETMIQFLISQLRTSRPGQELLTHTNDKKDETALVLSDKLRKRWNAISSTTKWQRITYRQAIEHLQSAVSAGHHFNFQPDWDSGLQTEHELWIASNIGKGSPVFVTDYPRSQKPFYMLPTPDQPDGDTVACFDLLMPDIGEVVGGSLREHRYAQLMESMKRSGFNDEAIENLSWYTDLRKWGSVPHGGFGLGFDRLLGYLSGVSNIKDVATFPRWVGRCDC